MIPRISRSNACWYISTSNLSTNCLYIANITLSSSWFTIISDAAGSSRNILSISCTMLSISAFKQIWLLTIELSACLTFSSKTLPSNHSYFVFLVLRLYLWHIQQSYPIAHPSYMHGMHHEKPETHTYWYHSPWFQSGNLPLFFHRRFYIVISFHCRNQFYFSIYFTHSFTPYNRLIKPHKSSSQFVTLL